MKHYLAPLLFTLLLNCLIGSIHCLAQTTVFTENSGITKDKVMLLAQKKTISASEAAKKAQSQHGGKVLSVEQKKTDDGVVYYIKLLLDSGRVKTVTIRG